MESPAGCLYHVGQHDESGFLALWARTVVAIFILANALMIFVSFFQCLVIEKLY
jgi:hypothetical protein